MNCNSWCRSRFISTRVLFQIFSGAATDITVAKTHSSSHQFQYGSMANSHFGFVAMASATRPNSRPTHASSGSNSHDIFACRTRRTTSRGIFKNVNGPKFHKSSLLGMAWRINPPSKPAVDAAGMASHSCPINAGTVMIAPPIGPTTRPPSKPIKNAPSSERSPNRYGNPTNRNETPRIKGGVMNSISFSFWSGSRSSVNSTRRKVFQRASRAANEEATPTFSSSVNSKSFTEVSVSIASPGIRSSLTLANPRGEVKCREAQLPHDLGAFSGTDFSRFADFFRRNRPAILADYHGTQERIWPAPESEPTTSRGSSCDAAHSLWPVYDLCFRGAWVTARSHRPRARQAQWQRDAAGPRAFAVPDRRRAHFPALRLPRTARALPAKDRARPFRRFTLPAPRGPRHRPDEQVARLRTARRRHGHRGSQ